MLARGLGKGTLSSVVQMGLVMVAGGRGRQKKVIRAEGGEPPLLAMKAEEEPPHDESRRLLEAGGDRKGLPGAPRRVTLPPTP